MKKAAPYILLAALFAGAGWYAITKKPAAVHETVLPATPPALPPSAAQVPDRMPIEPDSQQMLEPGNEPEPEPEVVEETLPPLNESDPSFQLSLADVMGAEVVERYLVKSEAISRMVSMFDSLTARQVPPLINPVRSVEGEMIVESDGQQLMLSPDNYARYEGYVQELQKTDSEELLGLYRQYQPLFQQAWIDNGGEGSFTQRMVEVINELLATPVVTQPVYVTKPEAVYVFEDPSLEAMPAGQKILVRMGNANAEVVKLKLAEIKAGLVGAPPGN